MGNDSLGRDTVWEMTIGAVAVMEMTVWEGTQCGN